MALEATHVVVAGTGALWVAPEGTTLPLDLAPLASPWEDVGFVSEDGVVFTFSREQEEVNAWQSAEPVRILITNEPKTIEFDLLEFDRVSLLLAFRGGSFAGSASPWTYTPPDAGASDVRAVTIDGKDGAQSFRFCFPRAQLSGDLEFSLLRTDAVTLSMELSVLASATKWKIISDLPGFSLTGTMALGDLTREELNAEATRLGVENPEGLGTKADVIDAIEEAQAQPAAA